MAIQLSVILAWQEAVQPSSFTGRSTVVFYICFTGLDLGCSHKVSRKKHVSTNHDEMLKDIKANHAEDYYTISIGGFCIQGN